jgi:phenylacetate-CoA ligase
MQPKSALLDRLSRMSREDMLALQFGKLQRQLRRLQDGNGFYRDAWAAAGAHADQIRTLDDFRRRIPAIDKARCLADQVAEPPFGRRVGVPRDELALVCMTGGTSGQGQEVYGRTGQDLIWQGYFHALPWFIAGLRPGDVALNCVPAGGLTTGGWGPTEGLRAAGALPLTAGGAMNTDAKIDLMLRFGDIHFIYASTNYFHTLTQAMRRRGIDPAARFPMLKAAFIAAEGYPVEWARDVQEFWGCPLHEGYGSTQGAGFICSTAEGGVLDGPGGRGPMHCFDWHVLVEVVDPDTDEPVAEGEFGEVVLTNLDIAASPVVRFRTRDRARLVPSGDGRQWTALESGTMGRYDDMLKIRGNNVWPSAVDLAVFAHEEVAEYTGRVFVDSAGRTEAEIRLALKPAHADAPDSHIAAIHRRVQDAVKQRTNVMMRIIDTPYAEMPVFDYKARRWKDERKQGYQAQATRGPA